MGTVRALNKTPPIARPAGSHESCSQNARVAEEHLASVSLGLGGTRTSWSSEEAHLPCSISLWPSGFAPPISSFFSHLKTAQRVDAVCEARLRITTHRCDRRLPPLPPLSPVPLEPLPVFALLLV